MVNERTGQCLAGILARSAFQLVVLKWRRSALLEKQKAPGKPCMSSKGNHGQPTKHAPELGLATCRATQPTNHALIELRQTKQSIARMGRQKEDIGSEPLIKEIGQSRQLAKVCATSSGRHRRCTRPSTSSSTRAPEPAVGGLALATAEYERSCSETRRRCPCAPSRARCRPSSASRCWRSCPATPPTRCTSASATRRSGHVRQGEGGVPAVREAVGGDRGSRTASARPSSSIRCSTPTPTATGIAAKGIPTASPSYQSVEPGQSRC
jgi:hypothetical protein